MKTEAKRCVILVEDDVSVLHAVRRLIVGAGYDIITFDHPSLALNSAIPTADACLLVDVHLPEMNGVELCAALAASGCDLPVVLMTGAADEATLNLAQRVKTVAFLYKPFERAVLLAAVAKALSAKEP